jgi:preprotein translocase subunit YajC
MSVEFGYILVATTIAIAVLLVWAIVAWPQKRARQRQEQVVSELKVGEEVVTIGGLVGKLTYINQEEDMARLEIAKGVEIRLIPAAISHPLNYLQRMRRMEAAEAAKATAGKTAKKAKS